MLVDGLGYYEAIMPKVKDSKFATCHNISDKPVVSTGQEIIPAVLLWG